MIHAGPTLAFIHFFLPSPACLLRETCLPDTGNLAKPIRAQMFPIPTLGL